MLRLIKLKIFATFIHLQFLNCDEATCLTETKLLNTDVESIIHSWNISTCRTKDMIVDYEYQYMRERSLSHWIIARDRIFRLGYMLHTNAISLNQTVFQSIISDCIPFGKIRWINC